MTDDTERQHEDAGSEGAADHSDAIPMKAEAAPEDPPSQDDEAIRVEPEPKTLDDAGKMRQLFAQAQERFAAMDFVAADQRLRMIPPRRRTQDTDRLHEIVRTRLEEIASLRLEIIREADRKKWQKVQPKLQRLLELQPGDDWANELRHKTEEQEWDAARELAERKQAKSKTPPVEQPIVPVPVIEPIFNDDDDDEEERPKQPRRRPPNAPAAPIFARDADGEAAPVRPRDEVDEQLEEIWEFGDRLDESPPPLPHRRKQTRAADFDEIDLVGKETASAGVWIAVLVSSLVVLVAVVTTIVVLANYAK